MINKEDILADLHTHTLFSKHAYSTVKENIEAARNKGLSYIAITDHYFGNGDELDKKNEVNRIKYIEERVNKTSDVAVIGSAEFNLGQEIYTPQKLQSLKWKPIGLHNWFIDTKNLKFQDLFLLFKDAAENGFTSFVHIERELQKLLYGNYSQLEMIGFLYKIVDLAREKDIWLEVNESSLVVNECGGAERLENWLIYARDMGNKIYLGTDAHYCEEVGDFKNTIKLLNKVNYPKELILNCNENLLAQLI